MFCQKCGAELRPDAGFCAVCGATVPRPTLHLDGDDTTSQSRTAQAPGRNGAAPHGAVPQAAAPRRAPASPSGASPALIPTPPTYQAIRRAAQLGGARGLAPVASLQVPAAPSESRPRAAAPQVMPAPGPASGPSPGSQSASVPTAPEQTFAALNLPAMAPAPYPAAVAPAQPALVSSQPMLPISPSTAVVPVQPATLPGQPVFVPAQAFAVPQAHNGSQPLHNGYHAVVWAAPAGLPAASNGAAVPGGSVPWQPAGATGGLRLPVDTPNRLALGALICMFASFFLPWVIIGDSRPTPLTVGWPVLLPLAVIAATGLTILVPERTLYARFFLALPLMLGCLALGSALLIFLLSSAIAANTVGAGFLGVDIGFAIFALGAFVLACAGYYKLIRELPLLLAGRLRLAPLPGALRGLSAPLPPNTASPPAAAPHAAHNGASQNGAASAGATAESD